MTLEYDPKIWLRTLSAYEAQHHTMTPYEGTEASFRAACDAAERYAGSSKETLPQQLIGVYTHIIVSTVKKRILS